MVYLSFDDDTSIDDQIRFYDNLRSKYHKYLREIYNTSLVCRNGTRIKRINYSRNSDYIKLQRMLVNGNKYIDIFPLITYPNSKVLAGESIRPTRFEKWLINNGLNINTLEGFEEYRAFDEVIIYKSVSKIYPYSRYLDKKKEEYTFLIRLILSA